MVFNPILISLLAAVSAGGVPIDSLPADALYAQPPGLDEPFRPELYHSDNERGRIRFDYFDGISDAIGRVWFWGVGVDPSNEPCARTSDAFVVTFFDGNAVVPGEVVYTELVFATRVDLGGGIARYQGELSNTVVMESGWVSVEGIGSGGCLFAWYPSETGNGRHAIQDTGDTVITGLHDLSFGLLSPSPVVTEGEAEPREGEGARDEGEAEPVEGAPEGTTEGEGAEGEGGDEAEDEEGEGEAQPMEGEAQAPEGAGEAEDCGDGSPTPTDIVLQACRPDALYGHPAIVAGAMAADLPLGKRYDRFDGITEPIAAVEWWGVATATTGQLCDIRQYLVDFEFYEDSNGSRGSLVASYRLPVESVLSGVWFGGFDLLRYTAVLPEDLNLCAGWISIHRYLVDENCRLGWYTAATVDERNQRDYSFCLLPGDVVYHTADVDRDRRIDLSELLRVVQFYNGGRFSCDAGAADESDGYTLGIGDETCRRHSADFEEPYWEVRLSELLRAIQLFNVPGTHRYCLAGTDDEFCVEF